MNKLTLTTKDMLLIYNKGVNDANSMLVKQIERSSKKYSKLKEHDSLLLSDVLVHLLQNKITLDHETMPDALDLAANFLDNLPFEDYIKHFGLSKEVK